MYLDNENPPAPPAPVTREDLRTLLDLPPEFLRESIQIMAQIVGPTHTDHLGNCWTNRDLFCLAHGLMAMADIMVRHLTKIADVMSVNADKIPQNVHQKIFVEAAAMLAASIEARKAMNNPLEILMIAKQNADRRESNNNDSDF